MRVLLIRPARTPQSITLGEIMFSEPIGLEMIAAAIGDTHEVALLDLMADPQANLDQTIVDYRPDAVGITSLCVDVPAVLDLAARVKGVNPSIITLVGGTQTYFRPEAFFAPPIDHVMRFSTKASVRALFDSLGRGEQPAVDGLLSRAEGYRDDGKRGRNAYWRPDRSATAAYRDRYAYFGYRPCAILQTSQGCSAHCDFCLRWRLEGPCEAHFSLESVMEELQTIDEASVMIFDNDFLSDGERLRAFNRGLDAQRIEKNFICYGSVHGILKNREEVLGFRDRGLRAILVGYESFDEQELEDYAKPSTTGDQREVARFLKEAGIDVWASFILHPDWSKEDFRRFRRHIKELAPEIATFSPLTPFPGLPIYEQYKERLLVSIDDHRAWSFGQVVIRPSAMSLASYYRQVLWTILYVNYVTNQTVYAIRKFGIGTVPRLLRGSLKVFASYVRLAWRATLDARA